MQSVNRFAAKLITRSAAPYSTVPNFKLPTMEYDILIVGANLGSILANHLNHTLSERKKIYVCYENANTHFYQQRVLYEQGHLTKKDVNISVKSTLNHEIDHSAGVGVKKFRPHDNEVLLRNNQTIRYKHMVVAMGQKNDFKSITGFEEAWQDPTHSFYVCQDHTSNIKKAFPYLSNFGTGESIVYIPPTPFSGAIENYNFFVAKMMWDQQLRSGKIGQSSKFTIINGSGNFSEFCNETNSFIRTEIERRGINLETGLKLVRVKKNSNTAVFQDLKTGKLIEKPYSSFYSMMPTRAHHRLLESGLSSYNGFLSVNKYTLQHNNFQNVFGLGDVNDIPTTKTFFGGFNQLNVVRSNLERMIFGMNLNARYDGHSTAPFFLGSNKMAWFDQRYDGISSGQVYEGLGSFGNLQYEKFLKSDVKDLKDIYRFKSWGPPHYKHRKVFSEEPNIFGEPLKPFANIHPLSYQ